MSIYRTRPDYTASSSDKIKRSLKYYMATSPVMDDYKDMYVSDRPRLYDTRPSDEVYCDKMRAILSAFPNIGVPTEPSAIGGNVYVGTTANAENLPMLKALNVTYILNCAGGHPLGLRRQRAKYPPGCGIMGYEELRIEDFSDTDIRTWFERAHNYIDYVRGRGGRVLIHCPGVSRSGAIAISWLCRGTGMTLLEATKLLKDKRRCALNSDGFILQLVQWCRDRGLLDHDLDSVDAPRYMRKLDMARINRSHLPMFL